MTAPLTTVFVYGTLMPGERNEHVARRGGNFTAQPATLRGYRLIHLRPEGYPGILAGNAEDTVHGYALTYGAQDWPTALPFLDALEGTAETPPLYTREQVMLDTPSGTIPAWVYVYARQERLNQPGIIPLPDGDWRQVPGRSQHGPDDR